MAIDQLSPKIFTCSQSIELAEKIAKEYGVELGNVKTTHLAMVNFNLLLKNLYEEEEYFLLALHFHQQII